MTSAADLGPGLSQRLTYLLKRALVDLEELHRIHLGPLGIDGRELAVLLLLEAREPESQQQAASRLGVDRTTMVGLLDGLEAKGLVERDDSQRAHVYRAGINKQRTQKRYLADMARRLFNGSTSQMVLHALGSHPSASRAELEEIRELLDKIEAEGD